MLCQILPGIPYGMNNLTGEQNEPKEGAGREWTEPCSLDAEFLLGVTKMF